MRTAMLPPQASLPRLCAHRGLSQACPENTLPAFGAALAVGAHELEFDLWLSRDGVPVVCHDPTVDRTTDGTGAIGTLTWAEIRRLDAGIRLGEAWRGVRVPCLEEVVALAGGRIELNIHLKEEGPNGVLVQRVCDLLAQGALTRGAYLALETEEALRIAREYAPEIPRACLVRPDGAGVSVEVAVRYGCRRIQFGREVTPEQIQRAREAGLVCNLFWSDDPDDARQYVQQGIDVILTNRAHTLIAAGL